MSVGLVSDVPNDTVVGGVEDIMERHGQFHHTETRSEMPWIVGQLVDDVLAEFIADVGQRLNAQSTQVFGRIDVVEIFEIVFLFHQTVFVLAPFIMPRSMAEERRGTGCILYRQVVWRVFSAEERFSVRRPPQIIQPPT